MLGITMTALLVALSTLVGAQPPVPVLRVSYVRTDRCAPFYDACLYPKDFRKRYGLYLKQVAPQQRYDLYDGKTRTLTLELDPCLSDSVVLERLLAGASPVGLLNAEAVLAAVLRFQPVRVLAPLQNKGDMLVLAGNCPADSWAAFLDWVKASARTVSVGYLGHESMSMLSLEWALKLDNITSAREGVPDTARTDLRRFADRASLAAALAAGSVNAAVVQEPDAVGLAATPGIRRVCEIHDLPPNWFANRPGIVAAATDSLIAARREDIERFLELLAVSTHYANNRTRNTVRACAKWLGTPARTESTALSVMGFTSVPTFGFRDGLWNWYFAQRLRGAVPDTFAGFMSTDEWIYLPWDTLPGLTARERAGARIIPQE
jgi:ABC-type nitrate/sulfonate/bicarbonate transport system substrate-binding protein